MPSRCSVTSRGSAFIGSGVSVFTGVTSATALSDGTSSFGSDLLEQLATSNAEQPTTRVQRHQQFPLLQLRFSWQGMYS